MNQYRVEYSSRYWIWEKNEGENENMTEENGLPVKGEAVDRDRLELEGIVIDSNRGKFKVDVGDGSVILAVLSGRIKNNAIKVVVGDLVRVEVSPYDMTKGRIVYRIKTG